MTGLKALSAMAALLALTAAPALAQTIIPPDTGGLYNVQDPSKMGGQPDSRPYSGGSIGAAQSYWAPEAYAYAPAPGMRTGFLPADIAVGAIGGAVGLAGAAVNTAGAIATAPFRVGSAQNAYAAMDGDASCAQRFRSYDPASGTYLGYDGQRHPCP